MVELDEARACIGDIEPLLIDAHTTAVGSWSTFLMEKPELALPLDATARANFIHCHIRSEVDRRVHDARGVAFTDALEFFGLRIEPKILLRFKFVGGGQPRNVQTAQQKALARQEYTESMILALTGDPTLEAPTLLTCGYTLDDGKVGRIEIRRDCDGHQPWSYDIYGGDAVSQPLVLDGLEDTAKPARITSTKRQPQEGSNQADQA